MLIVLSFVLILKEMSISRLFVIVVSDRRFVVILMKVICYGFFSGVRIVMLGLTAGGVEVFMVVGGVGGSFFF